MGTGTWCSISTSNSGWLVSGTTEGIDIGPPEGRRQLRYCAEIDCVAVVTVSFDRFDGAKPGHHWLGILASQVGQLAQLGGALFPQDRELRRSVGADLGVDWIPGGVTRT